MADEAPQSVDDLLMCLMSMGFEFQDCQDAVQSGKVTVEMAVEWLLAGKPGFQKNAHSSPSLKLRPDGSKFEEGVNPFNKPEQSKPLDVSESAGQSETQTEGQSQEQTGQLEGQVFSRLHLSDEQRKVKHKFEQKQIVEARHEIVAEKQRRKRDHDRILKEIAEDREKQKLTHNAPLTGTTKVTASTSSESKSVDTEDNAKKSSPGVKASKCLLQIRMADGRSVRQSFDPTDTMETVKNFVEKTQKKSLAGMCIIQPFPHKEFSSEDLGSSLEGLGLTPTGSIVVKKKEAFQASAPSDKPSTTTGLRSGHGVGRGRGGGTNPLEEGGIPVLPGMPGLPSMPGGMPGLPPMNLPGMQQPQDREDGAPWGIGHKLGDETGGADHDPGGGVAMEEDIVEDVSDGEDQDMGPGPGMFGGHGAIGGGLGGIGGLPHMGAGLPGMGGAGAGGGGFGVHFGDAAFQGVGQRLVPEGHPWAPDSQHHSRPARELAAEKARERYAHPIEPQQAEEPMVIVTHNVQPLLTLCLSHIAHRLHDPRGNLHSLSGLSEDLAQKLLEYLIKNNLLSPKIFNAFLPCYLRKLVLDCYPYATNDLLNSVRLHSQLVHLSLRSCTLITDAGLKSLTVLKRLKHLNLNGCKVTSRIFPYLSELTCLTALLLEETLISEEGLIEYLRTHPQCLQHLNLNKTNITEKIIPYLKDLPALKSLYIENTQVCGLSGIEDLKNLETLDVANTGIVSESLLCLRDNTSLTCLGISNTSRVNGDQALSYISGLKLQAINLPTRHTTTDKGMSYITNFHLTSLDLTNYNNIGDDGIQYISKISSLRTLLLSNTKITDIGMYFLEGLKSIEVLYLDRTLVTDEGVAVLKGFSSLRELSLSSTGVTSQFLLEGTLDTSSFNLTKLNLSRTGVTSKGVRCLKLPCLMLLNLDGTRVKPSIVEELHTTCTDLKNVTIANLLPFNEDEDE